MNGKVHAKDYLLEYIEKSKPNWLSLLIQKVIKTAGPISDNDKDQIFGILLEENNLSFGQRSKSKHWVQVNHRFTSGKEVAKIQEDKSKILILKNITHKQGINALIHGQSLPFKPTCTIIYGLNATGKSGYYRIIHELAGGDQPKIILANIYKPHEDLEVYVDFQLNTKDQLPYEWRNKEERGVYPFNQIKVFDSEYLPIFLDERESSSSVEPLGLNMFQIITNIMDEFKNDKLGKLKQQEEYQRPDLSPLIDLLHSQDLKIVFGQSLLTDDDKKLLKVNTFFSEKDSKKLNNLKGKVQKLEQQNSADSIKLFFNEKSEIDNLKNHLENLKKTLETITREILGVIQNYSNKKKIRDERKESFEVLKNIPSRDTEEWQTFIESARNYEKMIDKKDFNSGKKCLYCHQPLILESAALKLVQAYSQYLGDKSQQDFRAAEDSITSLAKRLQLLDTTFVFSDNLKASLLDIKKGDKNIKILVDLIISTAEQQKTNLEIILRDLKTPTEKYSLDLSKVEKEISILYRLKQKEIDDLRQTESEKNQKLEKLQRDIYKLEDKQNVKKWRKKIDKYFSVNEKCQKYESVISAINTRGITDLGSKTSNKLLTENIRKSFEDELKALGKVIEVSLEKTEAEKGKVRTQLKILGKNVCDILSKGEQNAVGLALFLAEINQQGKQPVVFDDPITSLDHEVRGSLARRLMQLSKDRQVIIFTHDLLFVSQLVNVGIEQKIEFSTHVIDRPSLGPGRVNIDTSPKMSDLPKLIEEYKETIKDYNNLSFQEQQKAASLALDNLRCCCEALIEEVLFAKTVQRFDDHIRVQNLEEAVFDKEMAQRIVDLHGEISEKAAMHNRSNFQIQGSTLYQDFVNCKNKFEKLHKDLKDKKSEISKKRNNAKELKKKDYRHNW